MKEIKLTQGKVALVNDEDYDWINQWKWYAAKHRNTFYAVRSVRIGINKRKTVKMHRIVLGLNDRKIIIDHSDMNGLNNQRNNLRIASFSENNSNVKSYKNSSSKYKGVTLRKYDGSKYGETHYWVARIRKNNVLYQLGSFKSEIAAAKAYNFAAVQLHGRFVNLNTFENGANPFR